MSKYIKYNFLKTFTCIYTKISPVLRGDILYCPASLLCLRHNISIVELFMFSLPPSPAEGVTPILEKYGI